MEHTDQIPIEIATDFRRNFETQYRGRDFTQYEAAYRIGYLTAVQPEHQSQSFEQAEPQLRREFEHAFPKGDWLRMCEAVRYGYERRMRKS